MFCPKCFLYNFAVYVRKNSKNHVHFIVFSEKLDKLRCLHELIGTKKIKAKQGHLRLYL